MNINDRTINALQTTQSAFQQSENSALKYTINYTSLLQAATISTSTWTSDTATIASPAISGKTTTATISGPTGCHKIINKITTSASETIERIINLEITSNSDYVPGDY